MMCARDGAAQRRHAWIGTATTQVFINISWKAALNTSLVAMSDISPGPSLTTMILLRRSWRKLIMLVVLVVGVESVRGSKMWKISGFVEWVLLTPLMV